MTENKQTEWEVPQRLIDDYVQFIAMEELRDKYVPLPFCYRKARKAAIEAGKLRELFWSHIRTMFPRTDGRSLEYSEATRKVRITNS